jgi:hypothetical protein
MIINNIMIKYYLWLKRKNILLSNHKFKNLQIGVVGLALYYLKKPNSLGGGELYNRYCINTT